MGAEADQRQPSLFGKQGERKIVAVPVHGSQTIKPGLALRIAKDAGLSW